MAQSHFQGGVMVRRILLFIAFLGCVFAAPVHAQTEQAQGEIAVETTVADDAAIASRIREILARLEGYQNVRVGVADGIVTLGGDILEPGSPEALDELVARVEGIVAVENTTVMNTDVIERLNPAIERMRDRVSQIVAWTPLLLVSITAGILLFLLGLTIARAKQPWDRIAPNAFIADIYRQIIRLAFLVGGIVLTLDLLNATALLGTILGAAGIVGLAIGFAVRDTVENFIASIMLSVRQPFRPKDLVEIQGDTGHVIRLTSRATILLSLDGNHIRIPNATVFKSRIVNFSRNDDRRFTFQLGVSANADVAEALRIVLAALNDLPFILHTPGPASWVEDLGDSSINITGAGWIKQHETSLAAAKGEAIRLAKSRLEQEGITLPEPTYRLITSSAETTAPATKPAPAAELPSQMMEAHETDDLKRIVDAEREMNEGQDLLQREAPQE
ncbi:MAG: mechanosensitive ion channel domain-containing protein [Pseudomonadota bacterium]